MSLKIRQYMKNLAKTKEDSIFLTPWASIVGRNCDDEGELLKFKSIAQYRNDNKPLWIHLQLILFSENVEKLLIYHISYKFISRVIIIQSTLVISVCSRFPRWVCSNGRETLQIFNVFILKLLVISMKIGKITGFWKIWMIPSSVTQK